MEEVPVASTSTSSPAALCMPRLTRSAVDACAFKAWYPKFKKVSPKATIIDLEDGFVDYLKSDGLFLPNSDDEEERWA